MGLDIHKLDSESRSKNIRLQITLSVLAKGLSILLSLYIVPLTINFLGKETYGIWVTMLSIISWISLSDIGIGHGLKNKLSSSLTYNEKEKSRAYVSTAYFLLSIISIFILALSFLIFPFINWEMFFNSTGLDLPYVKIMLAFVSFISIIFLLGIINSVLGACQLNSWSGYIPLISSILFISLLLLFPEFFINDLLSIVLAYGVTNVIGLIIISLFFFWKNKFLIPKLRYKDNKLIKDIISLGGQFFIIQIAAILIFSTSNFLVVQFLGPARVTDYNIAFRLFSIFTLGFNIIITPYWSAYTEAYAKKDFDWIIKSIKKLLLLLIPIIVGLFIFILFFDDILKLWLRDTTNVIMISNSLIISLSIYIVISIWNNIFSYFLNGISKTKLQIRTAIMGGILIIPSSYLFVKILNWDLAGIVLSMCLSLLPFFIWGPIETFKILKNDTINKHTDTGI